MAVVLAMSAVIGYGGWSVVAGTLSLGSLVAFYTFVNQLFDPLSGAAELYSRAQRTFASIRQLQGVYALRPSIADPPVSVSLPLGDWGLEFSAVEFGYERQARTLLIPSLRIAAGERVAIVGENGAGKSTLGRLVTRLYDVKSGAIRIGGVDVRDMGLKDLRRCVGYLPRDPVLFEGSLASNLRFVRPQRPSTNCWRQFNWLTSRMWSRHFRPASINGLDLMPANCREVSASAWPLHEPCCNNRVS
jgi:ATP-binding cassette subfamily B protein